jgi:CRP-like cAMP-binding protein
MTAVIFRDIPRTETMNEAKKPTLPPCDLCESRHIGVFCRSDSDSMKEIDQAKSLRHYKPGETLFQAGETPEGIYCIRRGAVKIESLSESGQSHMLHVVQSGGILGLRANLDGKPFEADAVAIQATDLCFIPSKVFNDLLLKDPSIALTALRSVTSELHAMEKRFCQATDLTATERIAEALLHLKDRFEDQSWSRREFAEWASTTTETVIRTLAQFEKEGLIQLDGRKISILDRRRLLERAKIYV